MTLDRTPEDILREEREVQTPWQRLLGFTSRALGDPDAGFSFATGMDLGFAIAILHPEYAVAMRRAIQEGSMKGIVDTEMLVEEFIKAVPILKGEVQ